MKNGNCPTWFVQRWLESHHDHTARAPNTDHLWPCKASTDGMHVAYRTQWPPDCDFDDDFSPPIRNDWTIFSGDGKPVEFKRKPKTRVVGSIGGGFARLVAFNVREAAMRICSLDQSSAYDVLLRERKS